MRLTIAASAIAVFALAACSGGSDKAKLVEACTADGMGEEACNCFADHAEETLSPALFSKFAKGATASEDENNEIMESLTAEEQGQMLTMVISGAAACGGEAFGL